MRSFPLPTPGQNALLGAVAVLAMSGCKPDYEINGEPGDDVISNPPPDENPLQLDRIVQVAQPEVDVLFVVDNSCSMYEEQTALAQNFPAFMNYFLGSGVDYHLGVTSTDMTASGPGNRGLLKTAAGVRFIDELTNNPIQVFASMTALGTGGDFEEKGRAAAYTLIEEKRDQPANVDFYRDDASLHFVFVSDEEDQSLPNPVTRNEFVEWMHDLKWAPELTVAHGIYFIPGTSCPAADTQGQNYNYYVNQTGGTKQNLCATNWGPFLDALGLQTSGLKKEFFLTRIPVVDTIKVEVFVQGGSVSYEFPVCLDPEESDDCGVQYITSRNSVVFLDYVPDPFSEVVIEYNVLEDFQAITE